MRAWARGGRRPLSAWLTDEEFLAARATARAGDITPRLHAVIRDLVATAAHSRTLPPAIVGHATWTLDAIDDVTQEFLVHLLEGALLRAFDRAGSPAGVVKYLERTLHNWVVDRQRERALPRLVIRARAILRSDALFVEFSASARWMLSWWGLADWSDPATYQEGDERLIAASYQLGDLKYLRSTADRADSVISTPDVRRMLEQLFVTAGALLTLEHVDRVFRHRFAFAYPREPEELPEDEGVDAVQDTGPALDDALVLGDTLRVLLVRLTRRQLEMLWGRSCELTLDQLAAQHGCSRGTADNELKRAAALIDDVVEDDGQRTRVLEDLFAVTFREDADA
jgi:hypothetical protein